MVRDIWIFFFALGIILFNWPIISMFEHGLSKYLFFVWFIFIALIFIMTEYAGRKGRGG
jgi:hypothetical protein